MELPYRIDPLMMTRSFPTWMDLDYQVQVLVLDNPIIFCRTLYLYLKLFKYIRNICCIRVLLLVGTYKEFSFSNLILLKIHIYFKLWIHFCFYGLHISEFQVIYGHILHHGSVDGVHQLQIHLTTFQQQYLGEIKEKHIKMRKINKILKVIEPRP